MAHTLTGSQSQTRADRAHVPTRRTERRTQPRGPGCWGRWIAAGALEQTDVEDALYVAGLSNGLVHDDGERQTWATIRSGLSAGLQQPKDLTAGHPSRRRRSNDRPEGH